MQDKMRTETLEMMRTCQAKSVSDVIDDPFEVRVVCTLNGDVESVLITLAY